MSIHIQSSLKHFYDYKIIPSKYIKVNRCQSIVQLHNYTAKKLSVFVGEEPHCQVTNTYNETMRKILPKFGIEVMVMPRKQVGEQVISASYVRKLLSDNQIEKIKKFVPKTTYEYLIKKNEEEKWN